MIPPHLVASNPGSSQGSPVFFSSYLVFILLIAIVSIVGYWKMFVKAGKPGWAAIIPIYNVYVMIEIAKKPGWWLLLYFIPFANIVVSLIVAINLAKVFGKSTLFGVVFNWLIHPIGALILGFGSARYGSSPSSPTPPPAGGPTQPAPTPAQPTPAPTG